MPKQLTSLLRTEIEPLFTAAWKRQLRTAADILGRLDQQEGVILADRVGMGKTYVALCVAATEILSTEPRGQVVVLVPPAVATKWVDEWKKFSTMCLQPAHSIRCVAEPIRSGEAFLKALDDPDDSAAHLLIVTHTALTTTMKDQFIQLALLHLATRRRSELLALRPVIAKWCDGQSGLLRHRQFTSERVEALLNENPRTWRRLWNNLTGEELPDDPVPSALLETHDRIDLDPLRQVIRELPVNRSSNLPQRLTLARVELDRSTQAVWKSVLASTSMELPLLIVDEAHRLKNGETHLARLFAVPGETRSGAPIERGGLSGIFARMLFLTATPFELGHRELTNVLSRMRSVRQYADQITDDFDTRLDELSAAMDSAQNSALVLDDAWGRLEPSDIAAFDAWQANSAPPRGVNRSVSAAWKAACEAVCRREVMHQTLRPWIIRHEHEQRRRYLPGAALALGAASDPSRGLPIPPDLMLPFLLAGRAQFVANCNEQNGARPYFAYGIASSFNAFLRSATGNASRESPDVRQNNEESDLELLEPQTPSPYEPITEDESSWYQREIVDLLNDDRVHPDSHPKVQATVDRALDLWCRGRKCLIFFWYVRTGEALESALKCRIDSEINTVAAGALGLNSHDPVQVHDAIAQISDRIFRLATKSGDDIRGRLRGLFALSVTKDTPDADILTDNLVEVTVRTLRSPAYLVRYTTLSLDMDVETLWRGLGGGNQHRLNFLKQLADFALRASKMEDSERVSVFAALLGEHDARDATNEKSGRGASLQPVRRAHGETRRDSRERLTRVFNTPFAPDILVASSVMGEGIDLHQQCRDVIHHDLDWNPSVLEQRTGRLDRIGSLAERDGQLIDVYEPYLAGTHDEKMYKVVKDRAGWFNIVMGRAGGHSEVSTDKEENRIPLAPQIAQALTMDLRSPVAPTTDLRLQDTAMQ
ncbi:helicase-related protein [Rhodococcus sp. OK302]|uniref:helicase-related protein n=1 Tax=Rhodococcus sp. OK302 TaxID=1882769 RepID=UPI000B9F1868|nr:DEAD/DEAH box helicase [Rhodococcus sp. OK302]OYD71387.1 helicase-like protein [Rhodococcus sp. OK302]